MASYTTNLNLKKPAGSENVSIGDINNNMDTIDQAYGALNSKIATQSTTLLNPIASIYRQSIKKSGNTISISCGVNGGYTADTEAIVGTVPEGYRTLERKDFAGIVIDANTNIPNGQALITIDVDGSITFYATTVGFLAFNITYII